MHKINIFATKVKLTLGSFISDDVIVTKLVAIWETVAKIISNSANVRFKLSIYETEIHEEYFLLKRKRLRSE